MQRFCFIIGSFFIKGDVFIGEWGIFGVEIFLCYSQFFVKGDFIIGGVQCTDITINYLDAITNTTELKTISNMQIPVCCIVTTPTKVNGKCITGTPCILEVEIDELTTIQNLQLVILPTVHLKDEVEPDQVLLTLTDFPYDAIQIARHTVMGTELYVIIRNLKILRFAI